MARWMHTCKRLFDRVSLNRLFLTGVLHMRRHRLLVLIAGALLVTLPLSAYGAIFVGSGTNPETGTSLSATASFTINASGQLVVTLTNTGGNAVAPSDVLTALFFDIDGDLSPVCAVLDGSTILHGDTPADGNVGGEWALGSSLSGAPSDAGYGISAVGFGLFGHANFNGDVLFTPPPGLQLGGLDAGIVSANQTDAGSNAKILDTPLIKNHVVFTMTSDAAIDLTSISNVSFQFGTDLSLPNLGGELDEGDVPPDQAELVPEPHSMAIWGLGCAGLAVAAFVRRRQRRQSGTA